MNKRRTSHEDKYIHVNKRVIKGIIYMIPFILGAIFLLLGVNEIPKEAVLRWDVAPYKSAMTFVFTLVGVITSFILMLYGFVVIVNNDE